jgi:hypothetical protein
VGQKVKLSHYRDQRIGHHRDDAPHSCAMILHAALQLMCVASALPQRDITCIFYRRTILM